MKNQITLSKSNSSSGRWCVREGNNINFFWRKKEALEFMGNLVERRDKEAKEDADFIDQYDRCYGDD